MTAVRHASPRRPTLLLALLLAVASCARPGADLPPLAEATEPVYRLGPGDQVRVITFGQDQLTGEFRVNDSGNLALPLLGSVHAAGLTTTGLETVIAGGLTRASLLQAPSVAVEVIEYRPIFVLGEVAKPGQFPYQPGMTVVTAVAVAGGFTYRAIEDYAGVVRTDNGTAMEGRAARNSFLRPGDVITVFERRF